MKPEIQLELKKLLIRQYSELNFMKSEKLINKMEQNDWWEKEQYRLKVQYNFSCIGLGFVFTYHFFIVLIDFINKTRSNYSLVTVILTVLITVAIFYNVVQRKKVYKILELIRERKENTI